MLTFLLNVRLLFPFLSEQQQAISPVYPNSQTAISDDQAKFSLLQALADQYKMGTDPEAVLTTS